MQERIFSFSHIRDLFPHFLPFWQEEPRLTSLWEFLETHSCAFRWVGGCVRDALLGRHTWDIDIATPVLAEEMVSILESGGYKPLIQGLRFGSIRLIIDPYQVDITTLRRDVTTDGRWAQVAYIQDWSYDAQRRDLTLNALSIDPSGQLFDVLGGIEDLRQGIVRFVGSPVQRIREDALRLLRFFRFHQYYGQGAPDSEALKACMQEKEALKCLSAERIWQELHRMLQGPHPETVWTNMHHTGVDQVLWGESWNFEMMSTWHNLISPELSVFHDPFRTLLMGWGSSQKISLKELARCAWPKHLRQRLMQDRCVALHPWDLKDTRNLKQVTLAQDVWAASVTQNVFQKRWTQDQARQFLMQCGQDLVFLQQNPLPLTGRDFEAQGLKHTALAQALREARRLWLAHHGKLPFQKV